MFASPAFAAEAFVSGGKLTVKTEVANASNFNLTVIGPHGFNATEKSKKGVPTVTLGDEKGVSDGFYSWELTGSTSKRIRNPKSSFNNGRDGKKRDLVNQSFSENGTFRIVKGVAQMPDDKEEEKSGSER